MFDRDGPDNWTWWGIGESHALFFCVLLDPDMAGEAHALAADLRRRSELTGALRPKATLHVSLWPVVTRSPSAPDAQTVALAAARGARVWARPFAVSLDCAQDWRGRRAVGPVVLTGGEGVIGLDMLHRRLAEAHGRKPSRGFTPHVSILWGSDAMDPTPVAPLTWTVREFVLAHSFVGEGRYEIVARFPLAA